MKVKDDFATRSWSERLRNAALLGLLLALTSLFVSPAVRAQTIRCEGQPSVLRKPDLQVIALRHGDGKSRARDATARAQVALLWHSEAGPAAPLPQWAALCLVDMSSGAAPREDNNVFGRAPPFAR